MARKSNSAKELVELVALMPWWAGVLAAVVSYLLLTALASQPLVSGNRVNVFAMLAGAARWGVPAIFLLGAATSAWGRSKRERVINGVRSAAQQGRGHEALAGLSWQEFEWLVGEAFRQRGFTVVEAGGAGPDGGVDILLRLGDEHGLVQCKHWKSYRVGLPVVREMLGAMTAKRARRGWVITSGRFTAEAVAFAAEHRIELVDGDKLPALLRAGCGAGPAAAPMPPPAPRPAPSSSPPCPRCGGAMVSRIARKGQSAGSRFWGCAQFPECRGTLPQ